MKAFKTSSFFEEEMVEIDEQVPSILFSGDEAIEYQVYLSCAESFGWAPKKFNEWVKIKKERL